FDNTSAAGHFKDAKVWAFDAATLKTKVALITNTITCGRVGTAMPAWSDSQNGPLNDYQIQQLMTLITNGRWDLVQTEDNTEDIIDSHLTAPLPATATSSFVDAHTALSGSIDDSVTKVDVENGAAFKVGQTIKVQDERMTISKIDGNSLTVTRAADHTDAATHASGTAIQTFQGADMHVTDVTAFTAAQALRMGDERLRVMEIPTVDQKAKDKSGVLKVERGALGTFAVDHPIDEKIYNFQETSTPSENKSSCGQTAKAPAPSGTPATVEPFTGQTVEITAQNIAFSTDKIDVNAGGKVRIRFTNSDNGTPHNFAVYKSETDSTPVSDGSVGVIFPGPNVDDIVFDAPDKGTYFFRCDVHPTIMFGTFTVK
ncbi:MAG TPA: cupredoxin domain-containing protein, partial [Dehalococcoidia bacterium]|nr:cupredoxin domain-containing protein [Dehalococcoidia bacterium]